MRKKANKKNQYIASQGLSVWMLWKIAFLAIKTLSL